MRTEDKKELRELAEQLKKSPALQKLLALIYAKGLRDSQNVFEQPDGSGNGGRSQKTA